MMPRDAREAAEDLEELRSNAWCGEAAHGAVRADSIGWAVQRPVNYDTQLAPAPQNLAEWQDPRVGWGVVLADRDDVPAADKAMGADAPAPIRDLLAHRAGPAGARPPVLRYRADLPEGYLRWYTPEGVPKDLRFAGKRGIAPLAIPRHLLIVGPPTDVPWHAQCRMQLDAFVGRLDLDEPGLGNYVEALKGGFADASPDVTRPLVWAVDHGHPDITRLMRKSIAEPLHAAFRGDPGHEFDMRDGFLADASATRRALTEALAARNPAFVLTSSHGATFPLDDVPAMRAQLGALVDRDRATLDAGALTAAWPGHGAIWYAHACCSAGSDGRSRFEDLVEATSSLARTLTGVAQCGAMTAPLPRALLGGARPARAFIGHVEPTFNWTLRDPQTGQILTDHIVRTLYDELHLATRPPIGLAMSAYYATVGGLLSDYARAIDLAGKHRPGAPEQARRAKLIAVDRLCMVLLGDPTVTLPRGA